MTSSDASLRALLAEAGEGIRKAFPFVGYHSRPQPEYVEPLLKELRALLAKIEKALK